MVAVEVRDLDRVRIEQRNHQPDRRDGHHHEGDSEQAGEIDHQVLPSATTGARADLGLVPLAVVASERVDFAGRERLVSARVGLDCRVVRDRHVHVAQHPDRRAAVRRTDEIGDRQR